MQHRPRRRPVPVHDDFVGRKPHRAKPRIDGVVAHRPIVVPLPAKHELAAPGQLVEFAEHLHRLPGQRHQVRRPMQLLLDFTLHSRRRYRPQPSPEIRDRLRNEKSPNALIRKGFSVVGGSRRTVVWWLGLYRKKPPKPHGYWLFGIRDDWVLAEVLAAPQRSAWKPHLVDAVRSEAFS